MTYDVLLLPREVVLRERVYVVWQDGVRHVVCVVWTTLVLNDSNRRKLAVFRVLVGN